MRKSIILACLFFPTLAFAGGTCPASSSYMNPNGTGAAGALSSFGITTCFFIDFAAGSDANSGTDEAHAWQHARGMVGAGGNVTSHTPVGGEGYIFKGGVTWDSTTQQWAWSWSGTSLSVPIYLGYDPTWFTGGSWTRPILSCSNTCWQQLNLTGTFVDLDNFEFTGIHNTQNPPSPAVSAISVGSGNRGLMIYENYFHGSDVAHDGAHDSHYISWSVTGNDNTSIVHHNVFDNSDAKMNGTPCSFPAGPCTMTAQEGGPRQIFLNYYSHFGGSSLVIDNPIDFHNNEVDLQVLSPDNGTDHENMFESNGETGSGAVVYNNLITRGYNCGVVDFQSGPNTGITTYLFNNILPDMDGCNMQQTYEGGASLGTDYWFNNTAEAGKDSSTPGGVCGRNTGSATAKVINQHCITTATSGTSWWNGSLTATTDLAQSKATANGQGYTLGGATYAFIPTSGGGSTVAAGTNETSLCSAISGGATTIATVNTAAGVACGFDTSYGVTYDATNHKITGVGRSATNARPASAAWDIGAYQFAGSSPTVSLSPTTLAFGNVTVGTTSPAQSTTLTNTGGATLNISSIALGGSNPTQYSISSNGCGLSLLAGNNCVVQVQFKPLSAASLPATLVFTTDASSSPDSVTLTGTGIAAAPAVTLNPTSLAFGNQVVNTTSAGQTISLTNSGTATLNITSIAGGGSNPSQYHESDNCGSTLAASLSCTITMTFNPTTVGSKPATVVVTTNATSSPDSGTLSGTGVNATPAAVCSACMAKNVVHLIGKGVRHGHSE